MRRRALVGILVSLLGCSGGGATAPIDAAPGAPDAGFDAPAAAVATCAAPPPGALPGDIAAALAAVPGVADVSEAPANLTGYRFFRFTFRQPVDHAVAGGATFAQRATLLHRDAGAPTVLGTQGYDLAISPFREEPTTLVSGNQVEVEHRFFGASRPSPADWSKLTIWQAAADHHCLVTALRALYAGPWLATGQSKGGMTAVFFRRFFPDDVAATVAYVAPLSFGAPDPRYIPVVENGTHPECRQALRDFQRLALARRAAMETRMAALPGTTFNHLGLDEAFEHAVLELPFGFWQYGTAGACGLIPAAAASDDAVFQFLDDQSTLALYGDALVARYGPYYVQAANELGYPAIDEANVADLLAHPGTDRAENYVPTGVPTSYLAAAMRDVDAWVRSAGLRLLFVYGGNDPWSGGMYELGDARDSFRFVVAEGNHGSLIRSLAAEDQTVALDALRRWSGAAAKLPAEKPADLPAPERRPR